MQSVVSMREGKEEDTQKEWNSKPSKEEVGEEEVEINSSSLVLQELLMNSEELFLMREFHATLETLLRALSIVASNKKPEADFYQQKLETLRFILK